MPDGGPPPPLHLWGDGRHEDGEIGEYITRCHNSVAQYIYTRLIFDIVVTEERQPGYPSIMYWWEQEGMQFGNEGRGTDELDVNQE